MDQLNISAAWIGILAGVLTGAGMGLMFQKDSWLGGYSTWRRRLVRLAHISFFGLGFINLAYGLTLGVLETTDQSLWPSRLLILGAITMPLVCYLAAWRKPLRHLFLVPVLSLGVGIIIFLGEGGLL